MSSSAVWQHPLDRTPKFDRDVLAASGDPALAGKVFKQTPWEESEGVTYDATLGIPEEDKPWYRVPDPEWVERFAAENRLRAIKADTSNFYSAYVEVPVGMLTSPTYERTPDDNKGQNLLRKMRYNFDRDIFGHIQVNLRHRDSDGLPVLSLMDGRGRATFVLREFGPEMTVPTVLYFDIPRYTENKFYNAQDSANSRKLTLVDLLRSKIDEGDPATMEILGTIEDLGLTIELDGTKRGGPANNVSALAEVMRTYKAGGITLVRETLASLYEAFGEQKDTFTTNVVGGVAEFIRLYGWMEGFDRKWFIKTLKRFESPTYLLNPSLKKQGGRIQRPDVTKAILERYNFRLRLEDKKLPAVEAADYLFEQRAKEQRRAARLAAK